MQKKRRIYRFTGLSAMAMAMMLTSCINDDSLCPAEGDGEDQITLEFTVVTRDPAGHGTRALVVPANIEDGTVAENYLDLDNTTFLLFDETKTLIKVFVPYVDPVEDTGYAKYSVRAFMSPQEFHTLTDGKTDVTFTIAVVGNFSRLNPQNASYHIGQKLDDLFNQTTGATFAMPVRNNNNMIYWIPSVYGTPYTDGFGQTIADMTPAYIPMAGIHTYTVAVADLQASTVAKPLNLSADTEGSGDINMLRALAKIEVVDRIDAVGTGEATTQPDTNARTWIEKVELVGHNNRGSLFPTFNQWNILNIVETQYVTAPSIPTTSTYVGAEETGALVNFFADATATQGREDGMRVFSCYLTEYNPTNIADNQKMYVRITAQPPVAEGAEPSDENSTFYRVSLTSYTNGTPGASLPILRNNIYRYEITGLQGDLDVRLIVDDWTSEEPVKWEYTDNPGVTEPIEWIGDAEVNQNEATVMCSYGTQVLTATFTLDTPQDGEWTAQLLPANTNTASDAFVFLNEAGDEVETISGTITGAQSTIRIKAKYPALEEYNREAILIITVKNPVDGRIITADVLNGEYGKNTNFTIIQNASR